jgi:lysophospholipase L1-like esterase
MRSRAVIPPRPVKAACLGDSNTAFVGGYCDQLIATGAFAVHQNLAIGGSTIAAIKTQWNGIRSKHYTKISIMGGTVNVRGIVNPVPVEDAIVDLGAMYSEAKARGVFVIALTVPPQGQADTWTQERQDYLETLNTFIRDTVAANPTVMLLWETYDLLRTGVDLAAAYDSGDGFHLNLAGHDAIFAEFGSTF